MMPLAPLLAAVIYWEAASEGQEARHGVASVIWTRARGQTSRLLGVVARPKQFSSVADRALLGTRPRMPPEDRVWRECLETAKEMEAGTFKPTIIADHFHDDSMTPNWAWDMTRTEQFGRLLFYESRVKP